MKTAIEQTRPLPDNRQQWHADIQRRTVDRQSRHNRREGVKTFLDLFSDDTCKGIAQSLQFRKLADGSYYLDRLISCAYVLMSKNLDRYGKDFDTPKKDKISLSFFNYKKTNKLKKDFFNRKYIKYTCYKPTVYKLDYAFRSVLSALKRMKSQGNFLVLENIEYLEMQQVETRHKHCKVLLSGLAADYAANVAASDDLITLDGMASARRHVKAWIDNVFILRLSNVEKARLADIMSVRYKTFKLFYNNLTAAQKQFFKRIHTKHFQNDNNVTYITLAEVLYNNY